MSNPVFLQQRPVEVDVARLLLVLDRFALAPDARVRQLRCWPDRQVARYFTPEYYLQKLDFRIRNPAYLAYELVELHHLGVPAASDAEAVKRDVRSVFSDREPEFRTLPFRRFLRGAYERLDRVEAWWHSRGLVYTQAEPRGADSSPGRPQKYYFLTTAGEEAARRIVANVEQARWYADRIALIHRYFGALSPSEVKALQYSHPEYRQAQLQSFIPDLSTEEIASTFARVFSEELEVQNA